VPVALIREDGRAMEDACVVLTLGTGRATTGKQPKFLGWTLARLRETLRDINRPGRSLPMPRVSSTVKAMAIALALPLAGAGSAHAASTTSDAAFERQVRANLAANPGSVRLGPNQIQLEPGLTMTLHGRGSARAARGPVHGCNEREFCIYEDVNFREARFDMIKCKIYRLSSYRFIDKFGRSDTWDNEASSWVNNQTGGAVATLWSEDRGRGTWFKSSGLKDNRVGPKWNDNVESVKPC
jgi:hypothetical protein